MREWERRVRGDQGKILWREAETAIQTYALDIKRSKFRASHRHYRCTLGSHGVEDASQLSSKGLDTLELFIRRGIHAIYTSALNLNSDLPSTQKGPSIATRTQQLPPKSGSFGKHTLDHGVNQ